MILFGTIINVATVIAGSVAGYFFHSKFPKRVSNIIFQAIGLFTIYIGISMAMKTNQILILIFSMVIGSAIGEFARLDIYINKFSDWLKAKLKSDHANFSEGMVTAFLLYCMGSMTILGAFEEGTTGNSNLLIAKSVMDGFSSLALASALGIGVAFSVIPLFIFQGGLTIVSLWLGNSVPGEVICEMSAVGGLILIGMGISIMEIKKINVINMLPALIISVILVYIL